MLFFFAVSAGDGVRMPTSLPAQAGRERHPDGLRRRGHGRGGRQGGLNCTNARPEAQVKYAT